MNEMDRLKEEFNSLFINEHGYFKLCCGNFKHDHEKDREAIWTWVLANFIPREEKTKVVWNDIHGIFTIPPSNPGRPEHPNIYPYVTCGLDTTKSERKP